MSLILIYSVLHRIAFVLYTNFIFSATRFCVCLFFFFFVGALGFMASTKFFGLWLNFCFLVLYDSLTAPNRPADQFWNPPPAPRHPSPLLGCPDIWPSLSVHFICNLLFALRPSFQRRWFFPHTARHQSPALRIRIHIARRRILRIRIRLCTLYTPPSAISPWFRLWPCSSFSAISQLLSVRFWPSIVVAPFRRGCAGGGGTGCFYEILGVICRLIVQQVAKNAMSEKWIFGYVTWPPLAILFILP